MLFFIFFNIRLLIINLLYLVENNNFVAVVEIVQILGLVDNFNISSAS